jgi:hypothetical protein
MYLVNKDRPSVYGCPAPSHAIVPTVLLHAASAELGSDTVPTTATAATARIRERNMVFLLIRGCDRIVTPGSHMGSDAFFPGIACATAAIEPSNSMPKALM